MSILLREYYGTLGYIPINGNIAQKKAESTLQKEFFYERFNMPFSRGQFTIKCITEGSAPKKGLDRKDKEEYWLEHKDDRITKITKTEYNFALWLLSMNFDRIEKVKDKITEEIKEQEKETARLEAEERLRQQKSVEAKKSKEAFKFWLEDAVFKYKDFNKLQVIKNIFLKKLNNYDPRFARETCVLIDNFDNLMCRAELIDRLHIHNKASRICFEYLTGLSLPSTQGGTDEFLKNTTLSDFTGYREYKLNIKGTLHECYTLLNNGWFCTCLGEDISVDNRVYNLIKQSNRYVIADKDYFILIAQGYTVDEATSAVKKLISDMSLDVFIQRMQDMYKSYETKEYQVEKRLGYSLGNV